MRKGWYWETLLQVAIPLLDDRDNVWWGIVTGLMEIFAPDDIREDVAWALEAADRRHLGSGSLVILAGGDRRDGGKKAGRKRRHRSGPRCSIVWPWEGFGR